MFGKMTQKKRIAKRINAGSLAAILLLSTVLSLNAFMGNDNMVYAAESSEMGTNSYATGVTGGATLTVGSTYTLGGNAKTGGTAIPQAQVLAVSGTKALMQSKGLWSGSWPGSGELSSTAATYFGDLKNAISAVYLPQGVSVNAETVYWNGSQTNSYASTVHSILTTAANNYSTFGAGGSYAWLGTPGGSGYAYLVGGGGGVGYNSTGGSFVCAPAFTIDTSKVSLSGSTLTYATFTDSSSITATQSITSVEEGASVDLSQVITGVVYNGGDNNGRSASYKVSISTNDGSINGTTWTVPTGINSNKTVTLTIKDTVKNLTTTKNVTVTPRAARSIAIEKASNFPESVTVGETIDFSSYITVTGYDSASQSDGTIRNYTVSVNSSYGTTVGTTYTPANISNTKEISITVTPVGMLGTVDYSGVSAAFTIKVKPDTTGWTDRDEYTDDLGFHSYTDPTTDITWKYRYNNDGYILYLYTEDDVANIISDGHVLLVPSSINGVSVVGIGGGSKDGMIIPFIPNTGEKTNDTWTSIYIPTSVKIINDGAFYQNGASADIVIPGNVAEIGVNAFKESKITSVTFNDANALALNTESFADIPTLNNVAIRGNGVTIKQRVFSNDTGLTQIDIPNGTKFKGETNQNDSYAFQGTTGLTMIKMDTDQVYSNTFSANKNLAKVIFGENVTRVKYDWSGTAASNSATLDGTVARATYALNADTIFEMDKNTGGSPFGYANKLTIVGKNRSLDDDTDSYNNTGDPVTAKIAYLAHYYKTNNEVKGYAKGTGSDITITAEGEPAENEAVTSTVSSSQTGIEAYYTGIIFDGKKLEKEKTTVYRMYGDKQNGTYQVQEFYVLRTTDADKLLTVDNTNQKNDEDVYVTTYTDEVLASFAEKDNITVTDSDVSMGTVDVKVIVLLKDDNGNILVDHSNGHVIAYTYAIAIPVKEYTAENDFLENYGSYSAVISKIEELSSQVNNLTQTVSDKDSDIAALTEEKNQMQKRYDELVKSQEENQSVIADLNSQLASKTQELESANAELNEYKRQCVEYIAAYNKLAEELKKYISGTDIDDSGYFGTIIDTDESTGTQTVRKVVYINGDPYVYEQTEELITISSKQYIIYVGNGDLDHDGETETFKFVVSNEGVTILVEMRDEAGNVTYVPAETYADTIGAIQRKVAAQLAAISAELTELKDQIVDLEGQITTLQDQIQTLNNRVATLEAENTQLKKDKSDLEKANEDLKRELDDLKAANAAALEEANTKAEELRKQLADQEAAAKAAQDALEDVNASTEEKLAAAQTQIASLNANVGILQETNKGLQESLAAANVHVSTLEAQAEKYVSALTVIANATDADASNLEDVISKVSELVATSNGDTTALRTQITELTNDKANLTAQVAQLTKDLAEAKANAGSSEIDAKTIATLKTENASLTTKNKSLADQVANLTMQLAETKANTGSSANSTIITSLNNTIGTLSSANTALTSQLSTAKTSLASVEKENEVLLSENKELKSSNSILEAEHNTISTKLESTRKSLNSVQKEVDSLTKSNGNLKSSNKQYKSKNATLAKKNSSLSSVNASLKSQVSSLSTQLAAAKSSNSSTRGTATTTVPASNNTIAATATPATEAIPAPQTTVSTAPASESVDTSSHLQSSATEDDEDSKDDEELDADSMISGGASALAPEKVSNAVGAIITTSLPSDVNADEGLINTIGDSSSLDMITTNGASISETTAEEKEHANQFFRYYAANISELMTLGVEGISADSDTLAIEGMASIDIVPSEVQREAIANGEKATVEISYNQFVNGEDYLVVHESKDRLGSYDVQVVTAVDGELVFDLTDLSPVSFAHVNKNAATISVSSTLTGDGDEAIAEENGKSNRTKKMILFALVMILVMGGFVFFSIKKGGKDKGGFPFSGRNSFRKGSRA